MKKEKRGTVGEERKMKWVKKERKKENKVDEVVKSSKIDKERKKEKDKVDEEMLYSHIHIHI